MNQHITQCLLISMFSIIKMNDIYSRTLLNFTMWPNIRRVFNIDNIIMIEVQKIVLSCCTSGQLYKPFIQHYQPAASIRRGKCCCKCYYVIWFHLPQREIQFFFRIKTRLQKNLCNQTSNFLTNFQLSLINQQSVNWPLKLKLFLKSNQSISTFQDANQCPNLSWK